MPSIVLALIYTGAIATVWLWWRDTPSVQGMGSIITNAGLVLGLLSGYGFVILVLLMARLPPLERGIGADRLARGIVRSLFVEDREQHFAALTAFETPELLGDEWTDADAPQRLPAAAS